VVDDLVSAGDRLAGRYRLEERIAAGGTSAIWRAYDERIERAVAIKVPLSPGATFEPGRLRAEARITATLDHPAVVEVYDYGQAVTSSGRVVPFAVMPLLAGEPLGARLAGGPLHWREALTIAARVASVLAVAHRAGVVHQDVSAENVMLTDRGPVLLDFGLALEVGSWESVGNDAGTPPYVPPERAAGAAAHPAGDIYALGVLLFEMLVGHRPFPETTWDEVAASSPDRPVPAPPRVRGLPGAVSALCQRTLAAQPDDRPDAAECVAVLEAALVSPHRARLVLATVAILGATAAAIALQPDTDRLADAGRMAGEAGSPETVARGGVHAPTDGKRVDDETDQADTGLEPAAGRLDGDSRGADDPALAALDTFLTSLDVALDAGTIRPDVHLDLGQVATNLYWADTQPDIDPVAELRRKIDDRYREGTIARTVWERLDADVDELAALRP